MSTTPQPRENLSFIAQYCTLTNLAAVFAIYLCLSVLINVLRAPRYPTTVPWVGHGKSWIAAFKNALAGTRDSKQWTQEGYEKYSKHGQTFVLPAMLGGRAEAVVPREQISWMLEQPDSVLSTQDAHYDQLNGAYSFVTPDLLKDPYHERVVHKHLARNLNDLVPELDDEVTRDMDELLGRDTEKFVKLDMLDAMMRVIPGITNRMLAGEPLCRNREFIDNMLGFTMDVIRGMILFTFIPQALHPIVGAIAGLAPKYHYWRIQRSSLPVIEKRLDDIRRKDAGELGYEKWTAPNDFITWTIRTAMADGRDVELEPKRIALRLMPINFAAIHTTAMTGQSALLDILSAGPTVLSALREEALHSYVSNGNKWTKAGLSSMHRMDSAIRESQRHSPIALTFIARKVKAKEGITSPEGVHFEQGTLISAPWTPIASDEDIFERAEEFDAFRYSRKREELEAQKTATTAADALKLRQNSMVTTSDRHLPFSHGRHAW